MFTDLLSPDYGVNDGPEDVTDVNQFILYFNDEEIAEFRRLLKEAMKREYPGDFKKANASDTLLIVLKKYHENPVPKTQA
jgi:hypothetical protein